MLTWKLALRNLVAHRKRNLIMALVVSIVTCVVFVFLAFSDGEIENFRMGLVALNAPPCDIVVEAAGLDRARRDGEGWDVLSRRTLREYPSILEKLRSAPGVGTAWVWPSGVGLDFFAAGVKFRGVLFRTVDSSASDRVRSRLRIRSGAFLETGSEPEVMLHHRTMSSLRAVPGDTITLAGKDSFGQVVVQDVVLRGFFEPEADSPNLSYFGLMNIAAYDLVSGFDAGEIMTLRIDLAKGLARGKAIRNLGAWAAKHDMDLEFMDYDAMYRQNDGVYGLVRNIMYAAAGLIIFVVTFGIMSAVAANLHDRKREIGTYYCLGADKRFLIRLYALEILLLNLVSSALGVAAGLGVRQIVNSLGLRTEDSGLQLVFGGSELNLGMSAGSVFFIVAATLAVTLIAAVTTLGKSLRVQPAAALRETE